ncbi:MAG: TIM barrel protein [Candidatus Pacearchaeota archaeon]
MAPYEIFYEGAGYHLDPKYNFTTGYRQPASNFALTLDARTANQLQEIAKKINIGAKEFEVQGTFKEVLDHIPDPHLKEISRQAKLAGVNLSFHGPLVEPSGFNSQASRWDESQRKQAEIQLKQAVERGHMLNPDGNIVITLHSTAELPEMLQREKVKGEEKITSMFVIDPKTGSVGPLRQEEHKFPQSKEDKPYEFDPNKELQLLNQRIWAQQKNQVAYYAERASEALESIERLKSEKPEVYEINKLIQSGQVSLNDVREQFPEMSEFLGINLERGERFAKINLEDSYNQLRQLYDTAYKSAEERNDAEGLRKLKEFANKVRENYEKLEKNDLETLNEIVKEGIRVLDELKSVQIYKPLNEFIMDKSSETFANVALNAYEKFKDKSPIISIENPPAGSGISRAEDLKLLIEKTRNKFIENLREKKGYSESEAKAIAEKLIGATWDVGHINMIRKYGYEKEDVLKEAKKISPYLKHVHLSDNFGMEHTELPMGMGNVPMEETIKIFGDKFNKLSKVIETGGWYQHFKISPFPSTLSAFGSSAYKTGVSPYWNQFLHTSPGYFAGYGTINPDIYHSIWGRSFSALPQELGGQVQTGRESRFGGTPMQ